MFVKYADIISSGKRKHIGIGKEVEAKSLPAMKAGIAKKYRASKVFLTYTIPQEPVV